MSPRLLRPRASTGNRYAALRTSLVAYWPLNETADSGDVTAEDWTRRGNNLTSNNTVPSVAGIQKNGRLFTAANSEFLSINNNADVQFGNGDWAISFWLYSQNTTSGYTHPVGKDGSGAREWGMRLQADASGSANRMEISCQLQTGLCPVHDGILTVTGCLFASPC